MFLFYRWNIWLGRRLKIKQQEYLLFLLGSKKLKKMMKYSARLRWSFANVKQYHDSISETDGCSHAAAETNWLRGIEPFSTWLRVRMEISVSRIVVQLIFACNFNFTQNNNGEKKVSLAGGKWIKWRIINEFSRAIKKFCACVQTVFSRLRTAHVSRSSRSVRTCTHR